MVNISIVELKRTVCNVNVFFFTKVRLHNGTEYEGKVEEIDAISDLALVRINCVSSISIKVTV